MQGIALFFKDCSQDFYGIDTYKVFNENYDKRLVFLESFITTEVEAAGVKVPSIKEVTFNDNHWCFKSDSIKGDTLFSLIKNDPDNVDKYLDKMVEVHTSIHKFKCPKLPIQKDKLTDYIKLSDLDEGMKIDTYKSGPEPVQTYACCNQ